MAIDWEKERQRRNRETLHERLAEIRSDWPRSKPIQKKKKQRKSKAQRRREGAVNRLKYSLRSYCGRNSRVQKLGFQNYTEYLNSPLWESIRKKVLTKGSRCVKCHGPAGQIHHSSYNKETLKGIDLQHLHPVCRECHKDAEFDKQGRKVSLEEANHFLLGTPQRAEVKKKNKRKRKRKRLGCRNTRLAPEHWRKHQ